MTVHGRAASGAPSGQVEDGPQVLLELARHRAVDGPVAGVVRPHRELVDEHPPVRGSRTARRPGRRSRRARPAIRQRDLLRLRRPGRDRGPEPGRSPRGRRRRRCDRVHDRPGRRLARRRPRDQGGSSRRERHPLLGQQVRRAGDSKRRGAVRRLVDDPARPCRRTRRAVVFRTHRPVRPRRRTRPAARARPRAAARARHAERRQSRSRITTLSWACTSASGPGRTASAVGSSACRCSVGTCSWSKVSTSHPSANARKVSRSV